MDKGWTHIVTDPKERRVFDALADAAYDFRTINGLARATGLEETEIEEIISRYPNLIRKSLVPYRKGGEIHRLYTLSVNKQGVGEVLNIIRTLVSKST
jgi:hypothetical protein